jgi:hypothetical protein
MVDKTDKGAKEQRGKVRADILYFVPLLPCAFIPLSLCPFVPLPLFLET